LFLIFVASCAAAVGWTALKSVLAKSLGVKTGHSASLEKKSDATDIEKYRFFGVFGAPILAPNTVNKASNVL
jgi:hypothetical protein